MAKIHPTNVIHCAFGQSDVDIDIESGIITNEFSIGSIVNNIGKILKRLLITIPLQKSEAAIVFLVISLFERYENERHHPLIQNIIEIDTQ